MHQNVLEKNEKKVAKMGEKTCSIMQWGEQEKKSTKIVNSQQPDRFTFLSAKGYDSWYFY